MSTPDDEALSWGDDDPTLHKGRPAAEESAEPALPDGFTAVGKGSDAVGRIEADGTVVMPGKKKPLGNGMLLTLGVLAGVYLLYTAGWIVGGLRLRQFSDFLVSPIAYVPAFILTIGAPAIWYLASFVLTRHSATWVRLSWLLAGALLLIPWPFIMVGAIGR